jgi:hypothetical protein
VSVTSKSVLVFVGQAGHSTKKKKNCKIPYQIMGEAFLNIFFVTHDFFLKYFKCLTNCRSLPLMLLKMVFRFKLWMEKFVGMILNIASAGKIDAGTSSYRQQPSQMEAFRGQAMLRAQFGEKRKRQEPIRSDQSATLFRHVPISSKLAHFLLKQSKQIHNREKKIE